MDETIEIKKRPLTDAELTALAALASVAAADVTAANQARANAGLSPAYDGCPSEAADRLEEELRRRGVLARRG